VLDTGILPKLKCTVPGIRGKIRDAVRRLKPDESTIILDDINAHVGNAAGIRKGVIGQHEDVVVNDNRRLFLRVGSDLT